MNIWDENRKCLQPLTLSDQLMTVHTLPSMTSGWTHLRSQKNSSKGNGIITWWNPQEQWEPSSVPNGRVGTVNKTTNHINPVRPWQTLVTVSLSHHHHRLDWHLNLPHRKLAETEKVKCTKCNCVWFDDLRFHWPGWKRLFTDRHLIFYFIIELFLHHIVLGLNNEKYVTARPRVQDHLWPLRPSAHWYQLKIEAKASKSTSSAPRETDSVDCRALVWVTITTSTKIITIPYSPTVCRTRTMPAGGGGVGVPWHSWCVTVWLMFYTQNNPSHLWAGRQGEAGLLTHNLHPCWLHVGEGGVSLTVKIAG